MFIYTIKIFKHFFNIIMNFDVGYLVNAGFIFSQICNTGQIQANHKNDNVTLGYFCKLTKGGQLSGHRAFIILHILWDLIGAE